MTQASAPMSTAIKVITGLVLAMAALMLLAGVKVWGLLLGGAILAIVALFCYLRAPVAYELTGDELTVRLRLGRKVFPAVTGCSTLSARPPMGLRLWGNGGLFAATGIFWNQAYGVYRVYVTSARYQDYVLVATRTRKILISPGNPAEFVRAWASSAPAAPAPG
ncbi:MAG: PH domain-containing protein [Deltaproteobacteria bacterium]|nr:PH domain-containing protein [Deltaproteobacteria bacterium]